MHLEFIRRFALHILPKRFTSSVRPMDSGVKIWHYGFLSSIPQKRDRLWKRQKLKLLQEKLKVKVLKKSRKEAFFA